MTQEITWTNCADAMPPDDNTEIIVDTGIGILKTNGCELFNTFHQDIITKYWKYTLYTHEKWKELNK